MKKFKVIEEGRILSSQEMQSIEGGAILECELVYQNCGAKGYTTCRIGFAGYSIDYCVSILESCPQGRNFSTGGGNQPVTLCPALMQY